MSDAGYKHKTLVGNWYEESLAPVQESKKYPDERINRGHEDAISTLTASGVPKPLGCINRMKKWNTSGVIPDDGFRDMYTIHRTEIPDPYKKKAELQKPPPHLEQTTGESKTIINKDNIARLTHVQRDLKGPSAGFGAVLQRHQADHNKRYFDTTYSQVHNAGAQPSVERKTEEKYEHYKTTKEQYHTGAPHEELKVAGSTVKDVYLQLKGKQNPDLLCGEQFKIAEDPQKNTKIQRSWMYSPDPAIKAKESYPLPNQILDKDNENSLPIGEGEYFRRSAQHNPGAYRKIRSDVTTYPSQHIDMGLR